MSKHDDLVKKLKEIFQIDRPELDFGVYRILNARVAEINDYLENRLKAKVVQSLAASDAANKESAQKELKEKEAQYRSDGIDPETVPKVRELRQKLADYGVGASEHENAVFTHLLTFFSRYYDSGDFISKRRYKGDTYAIPYAGEEVVLHWANKDQYYTKSGENFSNYAFKLDDGRSVRFRLVTADTAKDNRKDNDKERRFVLVEPITRTITDDEGDEYEEALLPVAEENGELVLRFEYKAMPKGTKQDALVVDATNKVLANPIVKARWLDLNNREPTEKNPQRTLLEKCLTNYTARNSADYFIHKDLGVFLRRELDFYIKNEVMHLDDVQYAKTFADIEKNLRLIQNLRAIALDLITFLAQLEDFQKKLWLKKKFIVSTHYCMTLDRIIKDALNLLDVIAANPKQWDQWQTLGMLHSKTDLLNQATIGTIDYLKENPYLMVDSALFDVTFKHALLAAVDNLDDSLDGLLIHGDNFQALNLLQERYREQVKCIYIDPPYNSAASEIIYKNNYKHSSWLSLMENRYMASRILLQADGIISTAIDDIEFHRLKACKDGIYGSDNHISNLAIMHNPKGRDQKYVAVSHEYTILFAKDKISLELNRLKLSGDEIEVKYPKKDDVGRYRELPLRRRGSGAARTDRPYMYFPFLVNRKTAEISVIDHCEYEKIFVDKEFKDEFVDELKAKYEGLGYDFILPIRDDGSLGRWRWGFTRCVEFCSRDVFFIRGKDSPTIYAKDYANDTFLPKSLWYDNRYDASTKGTNLLKNIVPNNTFDYPKSVFAVQDIVYMGSTSDSYVLDYFAGSGTTGHAVINLNRADKGHRKYILVEQGEYFSTVLKPRIQKVVYSADWKDGKATAPHTGISHAFKVLKIESYEDTLNNLQLRRTKAQQDLLDTLPQSAQEDYLLRYMLDIESRGSLLSVEQFKQPFDCKLKVTMDSAGAYEERTIDLVETFNYLIGLRVEHIDIDLNQGFASVKGYLPTGEKTLIFWRDCEKLPYEKLWLEQDLTETERAKSILGRLKFNPRDAEFDVFFINGDHTIPAVFTSLESEGGIKKELKIRQIEPEFLSRMFAVEVV
jgi:adenine-specific DNA-methyltransferase